MKIGNCFLQAIILFYINGYIHDKYNNILILKMELNNYKFTIAIIGKRKVGKSDLFYTIFKNERDGSYLPVKYTLYFG